MILTGRPVRAPEAYGMGLANRLVPVGTARTAAEELAAEIARFPQACLRGDRASALEQEGLPEEEAMRGELRHGTDVLAQGLEGAARFASGAGRHGSFTDV
jgi:enoyl-CoA hydratase